jgi:hypothetical protein
VVWDDRSFKQISVQSLRRALRSGFKEVAATDDFLGGVLVGVAKAHAPMAILHVALGLCVPIASRFRRSMVQLSSG